MDTKNLETIKVLRHYLHSCPELSLHEAHTKQTLISFLTAHTRLKVIDRGRWFYAFRKGTKGAPSLAFRADFDALPIDETIELPYASKIRGVSHKCGHDGHSAILAGLALELDKIETDGDVYLVFQHAEEIGAGGEECAQLIEEKGIAHVYAIHNWSAYPENTIIVRHGISQCASMGLTVRFVGAPAHASQPENGKNPSSAVARLALELPKFNRSPSEGGLVLCTIVHILVGSKNFGCAPAEGEISITLRSDRERDLDALNDSIRGIAERLAEEDGLSVSFEESDRFPETVNDNACVDAVIAAAQKLGLPVLEEPLPRRGSEDFGWYLKKCPGAMFYIGNGEDYPALHTFGYDFNDRILETGVDMFLALVKG